MEEERDLISHFHGFTFKKKNISLLKDKMKLCNLLATGRISYYNPMVLKNAVVNYTTLEYKWRKKLLEDFYLKDHKEILETQISDFNEFWQAYINTYKKDPKNLYSKIQNKLEQTKYKDYWFLNPKLKKCIPLLKKYEEEKKKKKYNGKQEQEFNTKIEAIKKYKEEENYSPFVAMSKLPRHAIKFALADLTKETNITNLKTKEQFLGAVIITFNTAKDYSKINCYDVLKAKKLKNIKPNCHHEKQTEVDVLEINNAGFVFPIIKPAINTKYKDSPLKGFYLNEDNYNKLIQAIKNTNSIKKIKENLTKAYQKIISQHVQKMAKFSDYELKYQALNNKLYNYNDNVMKMQNHIIETSKPDNNFILPKTNKPKTQVSELVRDMLLVRENGELKERSKNIYIEILQLNKKFKNIKDAIKNLAKKEKEGMEAYETVCMDRIINLCFPNLSRKERDKKLAEKLNAMEGFRKESFVSKLEKNKEKERKNSTKL